VVLRARGARVKKTKAELEDALRMCETVNKKLYEENQVLRRKVDAVNTYVNALLLAMTHLYKRIVDLEAGLLPPLRNDPERL
jgi:hypothetical protein